MSDSIPSAVASVLPDLVSERAFIQRTYAALGRHGLANNSALAMVGVCRDELCVSLPAEVEAAWGQPFILTGLGGYLTAGTTGFGAGHAHAPDRKPAAYVYVNMPHIGVGDDGTLGVCSRPGMAKTSSACGALSAISKELESKDGLDVEFDAKDPEYTLLKGAIGRKIKSGMDLLEITQAARALIAAQVRKASDKETDCAVLSGIQVHLSSGQYIYDGSCHIRSAGGGFRKVKW